jgi:hypothetical protein
MANVKKRKALQTVEEWFQGLLLACIGVGVLIWKFIMGNPSNFEGGNNEGIFEHFRSSISWRCSCAGIRNVTNGSLFSIERFFRYISGSW